MHRVRANVFTKSTSSCVGKVPTCGGIELVVQRLERGKVKAVTLIHVQAPMNRSKRYDVVQAFQLL